MSKKDLLSGDMADPEDMDCNAYQRAIHSQFVGQWITSLAISVICCAILFVVFSNYITQLSDKVNMAGVRIEVLQEKYNQAMAAIDSLQRAQPQAIFHIQGVAPKVETNVPAQMLEEDRPAPIINDNGAEAGERIINDNDLSLSKEPDSSEKSEAPKAAERTSPAARSQGEAKKQPSTSADKTKKPRTTSMGVPVFEEPAFSAPLGR